MTLLNYFIQPERIVIISDTLVTDLDRKPMTFDTKVYPMVHLGGVVCGRGLVGLSYRWRLLLTRFVVARDFSEVNERATIILRQLYKSLRDEGVVPEGDGSGLFHFGYLAEEDRHVGYCFPVLKDFEPEELGPGAYYLPEIDPVVPDGELSLETMVDIAIQQRALPIDNADNWPIGGDLHVTQIDRGAVQMWRIYRFPDYDELYAKMVQRRDEREAADRFWDTDAGDAPTAP